MGQVAAGHQRRHGAKQGWPPKGRRANAPFASNPLSGIGAVAWAHAYWANDPAWANPGNGNAASSWRDSQGTNLVQATGANQPIFTTTNASFNNRSTLTFNGTTQNMATAAFGVAISQPVTIVMIARQTSALAGTQRNWYDGILTTNRNGLAQTAVTGVLNVVATSSAASPSTLINDTTPHLFRTLTNGAASALAFDLVATGSLNTGVAETLTGLTVASTFSAANFLPGDVAFVGVYNGDATADANWTTFINWARGYYGLAI